MKEAPRQTIKRNVDEPKLELGDRVSIREGVFGVVLARYTPSGPQDKICYIVELVSDSREKGTH